MTLKELVVAWGGVCVICGHPFGSWDCVSREHLTPKSMGGILKDNLAPSHYTCNQLRGQNSLISAMNTIAFRERSMLPENFKQWLNKPIPDIAKLVNCFGRAYVQNIRMNWNVEKKWPWWKFQKESKEIT
jgi:hypothetical protein